MVESSCSCMKYIIRTNYAYKDISIYSMIEFNSRKSVWFKYHHPNIYHHSEHNIVTPIYSDVWITGFYSIVEAKIYLCQKRINYFKSKWDNMEIKYKTDKRYNELFGSDIKYLRNVKLKFPEYFI